MISNERRLLVDLVGVVVVGLDGGERVVDQTVVRLVRTNRQDDVTHRSFRLNEEIKAFTAHAQLHCIK